MSGGSYNYLGFSVNLADVLALEDQLERMAARLKKTPNAELAARETSHLLEELQRWQEHTTEALTRLHDVWTTVEWVDSGDGSEADVAHSLRMHATGWST